MSLSEYCAPDLDMNSLRVQLFDSVYSLRSHWKLKIFVLLPNNSMLNSKAKSEYGIILVPCMAIYTAPMI